MGKRVESAVIGADIRRIGLGLVLVFVFPSNAPAEQPESSLRFEVASVKLAAPGMPSGRSGGGPGTSDPGRLRYGRISLKNLVANAYGVEFDRVQGPDWIGNAAYTVEASVSAGATKDQMRVMLQNLLLDRFHMAFHKETKSFPAYELVIAKGGPKVRKTAAEATAEASAKEGKPMTGTKDANGFPVLPPGAHYQAAYSNGVERASFRDISIADFVTTLGYDIGNTLGADAFSKTRIVDRTGLAGTFDFTLEFRQKLDQTDSDSPDVFAALEKQLGLRLQKAEPIRLDVLVIDRADRTPTEN